MVGSEWRLFQGNLVYAIHVNTNESIICAEYRRCDSYMNVVCTWQRSETKEKMNKKVFQHYRRASSVDYVSRRRGTTDTAYAQLKCGGDSTQAHKNKAKWVTIVTCNNGPYGLKDSNVKCQMQVK